MKYTFKVPQQLQQCRLNRLNSRLNKFTAQLQWKSFPSHAPLSKLEQVSWQVEQLIPKKAFPTSAGIIFFCRDLTKFSICFICLLITFKFSLKLDLSLSFNKFENFEFNLSITSCIGVNGFLISCANFLATLSHASWRSEISNLSCCDLSRSIIKLKFVQFTGTFFWLYG